MPTLVLGMDMVAALGDESFRTLDPSRSRFIGNQRVLPTAMQALNPDAKVDFGLLARKVVDKLGTDRVRQVDATGLATALMGDAVYANFIVVGAALQLGWLPVGLPALRRAVELNQVQVDHNRTAVDIGRLWVHDRAALERSLAPAPAAPAATLDALVAHRSALLTAYQDAAYASRYQGLVQRVRDAERRASQDVGARDDPPEGPHEGQHEGPFSRAVAHGFARLMAYKDEYEVARLYSAPAFRQQLAAQFDGPLELRLNLAPPLWSRTDPDSGRPAKREFGPWIFPLLRGLAGLRRLRGTAFDLFGRTAERRAERALVDAYERRIDALLPGLDATRLPLATRIAEVADQVRGYGPVKAQQMALADGLWAALDAEWATENAANTAAALQARAA